jgi:hypothetical protein
MFQESGCLCKRPHLHNLTWNHLYPLRLVGTALKTCAWRLQGLVCQSTFWGQESYQLLHLQLSGGLSHQSQDWCVVLMKATYSKSIPSHVNG